MISLCYVSSSTERFNDDELVDLLNVCHVNNGSLDVTGLLLYNGRGTFLQVLEGDDTTVSKLYDVIKKDSRHKKITCISKQKIDQRSFPSWRMGFRNLKTLPLHTSSIFSDFMNQKETSNQLSINSSSAYSMLSYFKDKSDELMF